MPNRKRVGAASHLLVGAALLAFICVAGAMHGVRGRYEKLAGIDAADPLDVAASETERHEDKVFRKVTGAGEELNSEDLNRLALAHTASHQAEPEPEPEPEPETRGVERFIVHSSDDNSGNDESSSLDSEDSLSLDSEDSLSIHSDDTFSLDSDSDSDSDSDLDSDSDSERDLVDPILYRVCASGDLHGDDGAAMLVLKGSGLFITDENGELEWIGNDGDRMVFTGDYVDRGPYSKNVLDLIMEAGEKAGFDGDNNDQPRVEMLLGNHEEGNLMKTSTYDRLLAGWVHPAELLNYVSHRGCIGGGGGGGGSSSSSSSSSSRRRSDEEVELYRETIRSYWKKYEGCKKSIEKKGGNVYAALWEMDTDRFSLEYNKCPPLVWMSSAEQERMKELFYVYELNWSNECPLGKFLRSRKIVTKIYDTMYMHGGLTGAVVQKFKRWTLVNRVMERILKGEYFPHQEVSTDILTGKYGPLWWRPLSEIEKGGKKAKEAIEQIVKALELSEARRMVVGHDIKDEEDYNIVPYPNGNKEDEEPLMIGIDIGQSRWIHKYGNVYGDPDLDSNPKAVVRASVLETVYRQSGAVDINQILLRKGIRYTVPLYRLKGEKGVAIEQPMQKNSVRLSGRKSTAKEASGSGDGVDSQQSHSQWSSLDDPIEPTATEQPVPAPLPSKAKVLEAEPPIVPSPRIPVEDPAIRQARRLAEMEEVWKAGIEFGDGSMKGDCMALLAMRESLAIKDWSQGVPRSELIKEFNDHNDACCDWLGVTCRHGRVDQIVLRSMGLTGAIPRDIGRLSKLALLDLSNNNIGGTMPATILMLHNLRVLKVANNKIGGHFTDLIVMLHLLRDLHIQHNRFTGTITPTLVAAMKTMDVTYNHFTGSLSDDDLDGVGHDKLIFEGNHIVRVHEYS